MSDPVRLLSFVGALVAAFVAAFAIGAAVIPDDAADSWRDRVQESTVHTPGPGSAPAPGQHDDMEHP